MNRIIVSIIAGCALCASAFAQSTVATNPATVGQTVWDAVTSGATNWDFTVDGLYAVQDKKFGVEAALVYKVTPQLLVGPRAIYFENAFYIGTVNLTLQLPFRPIKSLPWFWVTPIADVGSGYDFKNKTVLGIVEGGGAVEVYKTKSGTFHAGIIGLIGKYTTIKGEVVTAGPYLGFNF